MNTRLEALINDISGLSPKSVLSLGRGFVREEWKTLCFQKKKPLIASAIQNSKSLALSLVPEAKGRLLDPSGRVGLLRQGFRDPKVKEGLPLIFEHRFRPQFYEMLDRTLSEGRSLFAHAEEARVLEARLVERVGFEARREEYFLLNRLWDALLKSRDLWDEHRLYEVASERLLGGEHSFSQSIYRLEHFDAEPRLQFFWDALSKATQVESISSSHLGNETNEIHLERNQSHSLEDGAQNLFDYILSQGGIEAHAVVIEDRPEVRRTIRRVASERGIPLLDPRDPTLLVESEAMKSIYLELELVARQFKADLVLPWLSLKWANSGDLRRKIIESGVTSGLESYRYWPELHEALLQLSKTYPSRMDFKFWSETLLIRTQENGFPLWVSQSLERIFKDWGISLELLSETEKRKPLRFWLEELKKKIKSATPITSATKHEFGLRLYRVDQAICVIPSSTKVHFFGVGTSFFEFRADQTSWFSHRDQEMLSVDFQIASHREKEAHAKRSFLSWAQLSEGMPIFWEYLYHEDGSEVESLELILSAIPGLTLKPMSLLPVNAKILPSFQSKLRQSKLHAQVEVQSKTFPISFLNSLGNCPFTAYAQYLLKAYDERDTDFDLSPDVFGNLVHAAIEILLDSKGSLSPSDAFDLAWKKTKTLAWTRSQRLQNAFQRKVIQILETFMVSEVEHQARSKCERIAQEMKIEIERGGFRFEGRLDRIDQHADGIVLMDYKTSGTLPSGRDTLESMKGLQLPAYALALREKLNQEVVGAQYVQLSPSKTSRNTGFLFSRWNKGKAADPIEFPISTARSNSHSLLTREPDEVWKEIDEKIIQLLKTVQNGDFQAKPADLADCERCRYSLLCGKKRGLSEVVPENGA